MKKVTVIPRDTSEWVLIDEEDRHLRRRAINDKTLATIYYDLHEVYDKNPKARKDESECRRALGLHLLSKVARGRGRPRKRPVNPAVKTIVDQVNVDAAIDWRRTQREEKWKDRISRQEVADKFFPEIRAKALQRACVKELQRRMNHRERAEKERRLKDAS